MGTRSVTRVIGDGAQVVNMYRQMDGYPSGHGKDLFDFLDGFKIVNGLSGDAGKIANGASCLAAQMVAHFKDGPGNIYLVAGEPGDHGQDYEYIIQANHFEEPVGVIEVTVLGGWHEKAQLFKGSVEDFGIFCMKGE